MLQEPRTTLLVPRVFLPGSDDAEPPGPTRFPGSDDEPPGLTSAPGSDDEPAGPTRFRTSKEDPTEPTSAPGSDDEPASPTNFANSEEDPDGLTSSPGSDDEPARPTSAPGSDDEERAGPTSSPGLDGTASVSTNVFAMTTPATTVAQTGRILKSPSASPLTFLHQVANAAGLAVQKSFATSLVDDIDTSRYPLSSVPLPSGPPSDG